MEHVNEADDVLQNFRRSGDISLLISPPPLTIPEQRPSKFHERQHLGIGSYLIIRDRFSCYQYAMSHLLERHYPLIVRFMEQEMPHPVRPGVHTQDFFFDIMEEFMVNMHKRYRTHYLDILNMDRPEERRAEHIYPSDLSELVSKIEGILSNGFLYITGGFHGELYVCREEDKNRFVHRIGKQGHKDYWQFGKFNEWLLAARERRADGSYANKGYADDYANHDILYTDLVIIYPTDPAIFSFSLGARDSDSEVSGRKEFEEMIRSIDLRELVSKTKSRYVTSSYTSQNSGLNQSYTFRLQA